MSTNASVINSREIQKLKKYHYVFIGSEVSQLFIEDKCFFPAGLKTLTGETRQTLKVDNSNYVYEPSFNNTCHNIMVGNFARFLMVN